MHPTSPPVEQGPPEPDRTIGTSALVAAAVAAVAVVVWHIYALPIGDPFYGLFENFADLAIYRAGGDAVVHRTGLYDDAILFGMQFTYTPFAAIVFAPFALVSQALTNLVWWSATFAALTALIAVSLRSLGYRLGPRAWLLSTLLAVATTALEPVRSTIWFGQINVFLVLLVVWDLTRPAGSRLRGIGTGVAAGIKLTPLFFLAYLAVTRQWRTAVTTAVAFAATVALGFAVVPADSWSYWTDRVVHAGRVGPVDAVGNQSANGMLAQLLRFYDVTRYQDPVTGVFAPPTWMWILVAGVLAVLGLAAAAVAHRRGHVLLAVVLTGMGSAVASPFSWGHHWVWFVPLLVIALHYAACSGRRAAWLAPMVVAVPTFSWWWHYYDGAPLHGTDHPIGIGLFTFPRHYQHWSTQLLVPVYSSCYLLVFAAAVAATFLILRRRTAPPAKPARVSPDHGGD
ncbi:glycosyltransferase 87 family protein [Prescottella sp. R16]|uniref:glycosyltransferase 87 family protein n=1 Tax=Prescottella sp. R16 TaxID=3064529 RepID=UPI00272E2ECE|nr:glycosyltransferase 87 family protein [Prescottella sp. R16]